MTVLGHSRRLGHLGDMSGLPQTADISGPCRHFAFVPEAVISRLLGTVGPHDDDDQGRAAFVRSLM
jgi:hypothetical protein